MFHVKVYRLVGKTTRLKAEIGLVKTVHFVDTPLHRLASCDSEQKARAS